MNRRSALLVCIWGALLLGISSCQVKEKSQGQGRHVVLIGLDGWAGYSVPQADMPNLQQLMDNGAYTLKKRSTLPSSSATNWASMFMGASPELHGYTEWNSRTPELPSRTTNQHGIFPTVFSVLRDARPEAEIGCLYEWDGIKYVVDTLALNFYRLAPDYNRYPEALCEMAESYIKEKRPVLLAVCFDNPDHVGHEIGFGTPEYYAKLKELDGYIGRIIQAVDDADMLEETIFIVTGDHGGIGTGHGGKQMGEMETPFIISGKSVRKGLQFDDASMMQYDVASTVAYILGIEQPQVWIGRPMKQVLGE